MRSKYHKPKVIIKKIKFNLFYRNSRNQFNNTEGILLAGCTCVNGTRSPGSCGCWL